MKRDVGNRLVAEEIRKQLFREEFQQALSSGNAAIPTDEVFKELLRRLETAERK